jgi:plasmid stabilization system protein ParE
VATYRVRILTEAEAELNAQYDWYVSEAGAAVAHRFRELVLRKIAGIAHSPERYPIVDDPVRRCVLPRFPHGLLIALLEGEVVVIAVMHFKREPGYWKKRLRSL